MLVWVNAFATADCLTCGYFLAQIELVGLPSSVERLPELCACLCTAKSLAWGRLGSAVRTVTSLVNICMQGCPGVRRLGNLGDLQAA